MNRSLQHIQIVLMVGALALWGGPQLAAQGLPSWRPINPLVTSRSALGFIPLVDLDSGWQVETFLDYASILEEGENDPARILLDTEVLRLDARITRRIGRRAFVQMSLGIWGSYSGFLDAALNWYHNLLGVDRARRERRPNGVFDYEIFLPDGTSVVRDRTSMALSDLRLTAGIRHTANLQTTMTVGLPVSGGPAGYGLEALATALVTTARSNPIGRLRLEGSLGAGISPAAGDLVDWQRKVLIAASAGGRLRFWGSQSIYLNLLYHSPLYHSTTNKSMDGADVSLDTGFLLRTGDGGPEIIAGLVEDLYSVGPAVDLVLRFGVRW